MNLKRVLKMDLPQHQSAFLWGARKTGKSTFLAQHFSHSIRYDLLKTDEAELQLKFLQSDQRLELFFCLS